MNPDLERAGSDSEATQFGALWCQLILDFLRGWETHTPGMTRARKREGLRRVVTAFSGSSNVLYSRLRPLVSSWNETVKPTEDFHGEELDAAQPSASRGDVAAADDRATTLVREFLATTLTVGVAERLGYPIELVREAREVADLTRTAPTLEDVAKLGARLKGLWIALELRGDDQREIQEGLLRLLNIVCGNVGELLGDDSWVRGQMKLLASLNAGAIDSASLAELERGLREVALRQGTLKHSLDQTKEAVKNMVTTFIDRLGAMADNAGGYHDRLADYATRIERADNLPELSKLISLVMQDTKSAQTDIHRSRDELLAARKEVDEYHARVAALQRELAEVSERANEDPLTQLPNRRGLSRAYDAEASRADRRQQPLCLAILDVDNFKAFNDRLGHRAGDLALVHLARVVRESIRPSDVISRYSGEEFVILLPDTPLDYAVRAMTRVQRELTRRFFLHDNEHVLITFSAGVAQRIYGESQEDLLARADRALYRAKQSGKNRVIAG